MEPLVEENREHIVTAGADVRSVSLAIPLSDAENADYRHFRINANDLGFVCIWEVKSKSRREGLALLRSQIVGVL